MRLRTAETVSNEPPRDPKTVSHARPSSPKTLIPRPPRGPKTVSHARPRDPKTVSHEPPHLPETMSGARPRAPKSGIQRTRRSLAMLLLAAVAVSSLVAWYASAQIRSPAEVAARTAPPKPSPILVPVEKRLLATKIVSRGTGHYGSPRQLSVTPSMLKKGPRVITRLPRVGSVIAEGNVVLTISGRPVFLLDGAQPSYRDLGPGMSGEDVEQLERALKRSGHDPGTVDASYNAATGRAVAALYRQHGFEPVEATDAQLDGVRPLEAELVEGARARGGVQLPADEVIFVPATPLRITRLATGLGVAPSGALVTVTDSVVAVDGALPVEQAGLVKAGARVLIDEPALGIKASGKISRVAAQPGTDGTDGFHVFFEVVVGDPPPALVGASVRLTIQIKSSRKTALAVPVSAVSLGPDGTSRLQRSADGKLEFVPIEPGFSADGYVAVTSPRGDLTAGDLVVVGFEKDVPSRD
jgi:peptidoglycan hydrolase-like protein with peptidoglycan-binding domain